MTAAVRFLIVDDFSTMRRLVRSVLHELGYKDVVEADDGKAALPIIKQGNVDFLVTDMNMPGMPGIELLKAVRSDPDPKVSKIPVLLLTAETKREQIVEAAKAGVNGYVVKPFTPQVLREKIEKILASRG
jgi:two-component system chemotaxis response regulator CheY